MDIINALKKAKAAKNEVTLYEISFGYSTKFILPHKAMLQLMDALSQAEAFQDNYGRNDQIRPVQDNDLMIKVMERDRYYNIKAANLLGVPYNEFIEALEKEAA